MVIPHAGLRRRGASLLLLACGCTRSRKSCRSSALLRSRVLCHTDSTDITDFRLRRSRSWRGLYSPARTSRDLVDLVNYYLPNYFVAGLRRRDTPILLLAALTKSCWSYRLFSVIPFVAGLRRRGASLLLLACGCAKSRRSCKLLSTKLFCRWPAAARDLVDFRLCRDFCVFYQFTKSYNRCIPDNYKHSNLNSFHGEGLPHETQIAKATVFLLCCKSTIFFIIDQIFSSSYLYF